MASDRRVPIRSRLSTSRPYSSVPSQYVAFGARKRVRIEIVSQGWGAIQGARSPRRAIVATIAMPALSWSGIGRLGVRASSGSFAARVLTVTWFDASPSGDAAAIAYLRIEPGVEEVSGEIGQRIDRRDDENGRLQRRQVAALDREHQESAE